MANIYLLQCQNQNQTTMNVFPDDKIRIILYAMEMSDEPIKFDEETFHTIIYEYKQKHPQLLQEFSFRLSGTFPYSELLERIISRAKISRSIKTLNPDFATVHLNLTKIPFSQIESKYKDLISVDDFKILTNIGLDFKNQLKSNF